MKKSARTFTISQVSMAPWLDDIAKDIAVGALTTVLTGGYHFVRKMAKDINAFFVKMRSMEERIKKLEEKP